MINAVWQSFRISEILDARSGACMYGGRSFLVLQYSTARDMLVHREMEISHYVEATMLSVSDPHEGSPRNLADLRSVPVSSPVPVNRGQIDCASSSTEDQLGTQVVGSSVPQDFDADSSLHGQRGSIQLTAADSSGHVSGVQRSVLASLVQECGDTTIRSLLVEPADPQSSSKPAVENIREICSKAGGALHAISCREAGLVLVTFIDSRDCSRAKAALSRAIRSVASVHSVRPEEPEHCITGLVLAVKQIDKEGDEIVIDDMKGMLSIFGTIAFGQQVAVPSLSKVHLAVFEFYSVHDAAQAVQAIGSRSGSTFTLFLINRDGSPAALTAPVPVQSAACLQKGSQSSSQVTRCSSVPSGSEAVPADAQHSLPLYSGDANPVAFLTAAHVHAHTSPPRAATPSMTSATVPPPALVHQWAPAPGVAMMPGMPMQPQGRRPADFLTTFDPNEAAGGGARARTTLMIRNIPCRWTADDLLSVLSPIIDGTWDLLYMPCKNTAVANAGYAFMNFCTSQDTLHLYNAMHGHQWPHTRSGKICEIRYARIQGRQLLTHLNSCDPSGAAAFRGYLAYPSGGSIVIHGPNNVQPALPLHPGAQLPMQGAMGAQSGLGGSQYAPQGLIPGSYPPGVAGSVGPRPPAGMQGMPPTLPTDSCNTAITSSTRRPQELEVFSDMAQGGWPVQSMAYGRAVPPPRPSMQMHLAGVPLPDMRGLDDSGSNAYQLQCMLQSLMQSMPPSQ